MPPNCIRSSDGNFDFRLIVTLDGDVAAIAVIIIFAILPATLLLSMGCFGVNGDA